MFGGARRLVVATCFFSAISLSAKLAQSNSVWGTYIWSGLLTTTSPLPDTVELVAKHGFESLRLVFSPTTFSTYKLNDSVGCIQGPSLDFLSCLVKTPTLQKILADPQLKTIMLTTYDAFTWGNGSKFGFLDDAFLSQNENPIIETYARFVEALAIASGDQKKTFIISNWEGDNQAYCGSAYGFLVDSNFKADCLKKYMQGTLGPARSPADGIRGLRHWFELRQSGILLGRTRIATKYPNVRVIQAPEVNMIHLLKDQGLGDVLRAGLPSKSLPDAISYSSYEGINEELSHPGSYIKVMTKMRSELSKQGLSNLPIILGEVGISKKTGDVSGVSETRLRNVTLLLQKTNLQFQVDRVFFWQAVDEPSGTELFGLFDQKGQPKLFSAIQDLVLHQ